MTKTFVAFLTLMSASASALDLSTVEVVQSVPIETTLEVPGLRQTQTVWLEMMGAAKKTIDLEEFYVNSQTGQAMEPVLAALIAAAGRGVQIRLIVDASFYKNYAKDPNQLNQIPNIQVETIDFSSLGGIQHSKYFVVDGAVSFVGSANMDWLALTHIHEIGLRVADAQIGANLEAVFQKDWTAGVALAGSSHALQSATFNLSNLNPGIPGLELVASPPAARPVGVPDSLNAVTRLLDSARGSLKIQVYEYTTKRYHGSGRWTDLDTAIRNAAARGVHVQLLVDAVALKQGRTDLQALAGLKNIEVRTVTIPQWSGGSIPYARLVHSKYFTVDDSAAWVGSENWSDSYFTGSRNVGLTLQSPEIAVKLGQTFDQVWSSAYSSKL